MGPICQKILLIANQHRSSQLEPIVQNITYAHQTIAVTLAGLYVCICLLAVDVVHIYYIRRETNIILGIFFHPPKNQEKKNIGKLQE